jgi:integrase
MTWADYQGAFIRVRQSKTGEPLDIACHKVLRSHLSAIRTAFGGPIARNAKGKPFTPNSLSQAIRRQVEAIDGFPHDRSIHGLRYAAAARLDEAGCTLTEAVAVLGHRTYQMAHRYMAQRRASEGAMRRQELRG